MPKLLIPKLQILALDPATKTGWAHSCGAGGVWDLKSKRDESGGMRLIRFRSKLSEVRTLAKIELLVYEAARHGAPKMQGALVVHAELQSVIKTWCEDNEIPYKGYSPTEIKKHATGKGNAPKKVMVETAKDKWSNVVDDNHADALWLLDLATREYGDA